MRKILFIVSVVVVCNKSYSQEKKKLLSKEIVFKFYPNPVKEDLFILGTHKLKTIEIIDEFGKRVEIHTFNKSIIKMNVSNIKKGVYLLKAIDINDKQEIKKLIIN
ncbi:T9SS type A sorting domain-containing protein [uncultured Lacinutrix sp.]|uniref:T9SS type A sorting domain-containing protein n=1 Tax=uncultured Lacinutrix sp. TaxID=574032 RepID=UPI00262E5C1B|nr:T9SS type A sorting domain-containing protein [uncultured Lacinutrix sp.]